MASDMRAAPESRVGVPADDAVAAGSHPDAADRRHRRAWMLPLVLVTVAGVLRLWGIDHPDRIYFDEKYYANDAHEYLIRGVEEDFAVHPPAGKWLIAAGIAAAGFDPLGWRLSAALAGSLTVLMVYLTGLRLFRRRGVAALAALLLAVDGLAFTMSRIAMLDVFLGLFVVLGFWLLLVDRDRLWAGAPPPDRAGELDRVPPRPHLFRWLAGLAFGLALATKWSGLLAIGSAGLFVLGSELAWRRRMTGRPLAGAWRPAVSAALTLLAVPTVVYLASYAGWFANYSETRLGQERCTGEECAVSVSTIAGDWLADQADILHFHQTLEADHPYRATAVTWPTLYRPVAYYYESCKDDRDPDDGPCAVERGNVAEILGIGNPAIWWPALLAYPALAWAAWRRRDWRAWALLAFLLGQYVPWLLLSRPLFFFYTTPIVPFVCLALAWAAWQARRHPYGRWVPAAVAVAAVAGFLFWYPVYAGLEITNEMWRLRILSGSWI